MASKDSTIKDVAILAGLAGGGLLLYKSLKGGSSTTTPQQQTGNTNNLMAWIAAMMAQSGQQTPTVNVDMSWLSGLLGGSGNGSNPDSDGSYNGTTDDFLKDMNTVLNASGYGGFISQFQALNQIDHVENLAEVANEGGYWGTEAVKQYTFEQEHPTLSTLTNANAVNAFASNPKVFLKDSVDRWSNLGTSISQWFSRATGKTPSEAAGLDLSVPSEKTETE